METRSLSGPALASLALVLASGVATAQVGSIRRSQEIADGVGGFTGPLTSHSLFGSSITALGDVDGDGITDLAVGSRGDGDGGPGRGAIWILFLDRNGTVQRQAKISQTQGGFTGALSDGVQFGRTIAAVGDLDGDGVTELAAATGACPGEQRPRLWILFLNPNGTVRRHTVIRFHLDPAFVPAPLACDFAAGGLAGLGDVDGDGLGDLAVGAPRDDDGPGADRGAVWIVRLRADGSAKSTQKISQTVGGLTSELEESGQFGTWISNSGDLDGDGNVELIVSGFGRIRTLFLDSTQQVLDARTFSVSTLVQLFGGSVALTPAGLGDIDGDGVGDLGLLAGGLRVPGIAFMDAEGGLRKSLPISAESLGFVPQNDSYLGPLAALGDLDGDGGLEFVVGGSGAGALGAPSGRLWIVFTKPGPVRNGSGSNPLSLKPGPDTRLGEAWGVRLDCSADGPGLGLLTGWSEPHDGLFLAAGELLVGGQRLFVRSAVHGGDALDFLEHLPDDSALVNLPLHVQGLCTGAPGPQLSNALDYVVGF